MPFWSRRPAHQPNPQPAGSWPPTAQESWYDEAVLIAALADILAFIEAADDDRLDPDWAVQIGEEIGTHLASLSPDGMARVRDQLTALADEEAARGASKAAVEGLRAVAESFEPDEDREPSGDDARELELAVIDAILTLETLDDELLDPDDGMKEIELAAWHLSHLSAGGRARFVASIASREAVMRTPDHAAIVHGLPDALDLAGSNEPFDARNAEVPGQAMLTRKRVVVTTPKGRDQALRQAEALRQNGYVGRWEVHDERQAGRAQRQLRDAGVRNIGVRVIGPAAAGERPLRSPAATVVVGTDVQAVPAASGITRLSEVKTSRVAPVGQADEDAEVRRVVLVTGRPAAPAAPPADPRQPPAPWELGAMPFVLLDQSGIRWAGTVDHGGGVSLAELADRTASFPVGSMSSWLGAGTTDGAEAPFEVRSANVDGTPYWQFRGAAGTVLSASTRPESAFILDPYLAAMMVYERADAVVTQLWLDPDRRLRFGKGADAKASRPLDSLSAVRLAALLSLGSIPGVRLNGGSVRLGRDDPIEIHHRSADVQLIFHDPRRRYVAVLEHEAAHALLRSLDPLTREEGLPFEVIDAIRSSLT